MGNSTRPDGDISKLHPAIRGRVQAIKKQLLKEKITFDVFEAFRTPERQAALFAKGRPNNGPKVTWVRPWGSIHQYGLAVDFVLKDEKGNWSWDTSGDKIKWWHRMHEIAKENDMTPLFNSKGKLIELPHIQLIGVKSANLKKGNYPEGGDAAWADHLNELISNWSGPQTPPPHPIIELGGSQIDPDVMASMEAEEEGTGTNATITAAAKDQRFQKLHGFIKTAEGGFVNHKDDKGGATNFGITQATLADWRDKPVTVEDVEDMTQEEADAILYTNYYIKAKCDRLNDRVAMVVYNMAVHSGPKKAQEVLQTAFNDLGMKANGGPLEVDGVIGPVTLGAVNQIDASLLSDQYMTLYEDHLRGHDSFATFGTGWMNRVNKLRVFLNDLPIGEGLRPTTVMKPREKLIDIERDELLNIAVLAATGGKSAAVKTLAGRFLRKKLSTRLDRDDTGVAGELLETLIDKKLGEDTLDDPKELTPVNSALGPGIGRLLDGRKSVIGVVGLIAASIVPELNLSSNQAQITELLDGDNQTIIFTLLSIFTGWGFLGKIDKAIRHVRT